MEWEQGKEGILYIIQLESAESPSTRLQIDPFFLNYKQ